jgi:hypothetical protein
LWGICAGHRDGGVERIRHSDLGFLYRQPNTRPHLITSSHAGFASTVGDKYKYYELTQGLCVE